ncbi:MAG: hypothetical protein IT328_04530 [Caldilineaceae bacterium]|nr:hypothetical protein [Caldilineaceae bacterium]
MSENRMTSNRPIEPREQREWQENVEKHLAKIAEAMSEPAELEPLQTEAPTLPQPLIIVVQNDQDVDKLVEALRQATSGGQSNVIASDGLTVTKVKKPADAVGPVTVETVEVVEEEKATPKTTDKADEKPAAKATDKAEATPAAKAAEKADDKPAAKKK